ncbi:hypothetical protein DFJ74DRAFT_725002 [Hyaloraphidium curvatum]|nr:hypothetical protein DFJ74DRAFT_725002 [Hyaloraphidium curvatum]
MEVSDASALRKRTPGSGDDGEGLGKSGEGGNGAGTVVVVGDPPPPGKPEPRPPLSLKERAAALWADRTFRRSVLVTAAMLVMVLGVVLGFYFGWRRGTDLELGGVGYSAELHNVTIEEVAECLGFAAINSTSSFVLVYLNIIQVDLQAFEMPVRFSSIACGPALVDADGVTYDDIDVTLDFSTNTIPKGGVSVQGTYEYSLTGGPLYSYPFDVWNSQIILNAWRRGRNTTDKVPVGMVLNPVSSSFFISANEGSSITTINRGVLRDALLVYVTVSRASTSIAMVILIALSMWVLSVSMLITALDAAYIRPHRIEADVVGASISLLFALPQLRDAMPGIPSLGFAQVDVFAYSVCLLVSAVAAIILLWEFMVKTHVVDGMDTTEVDAKEVVGGMEDKDHVDRLLALVGAHLASSLSHRTLLHLMLSSRKSHAFLRALFERTAVRRVHAGFVSSAPGTEAELWGVNTSTAAALRRTVPWGGIRMVRDVVVVGAVRPGDAVHVRKPGEGVLMVDELAGCVRRPEGASEDEFWTGVLENG